ncbi:class I SAM-dependent methyltransferase [Pseudohaliea sp.]|uniref:class I SAM-dependent methyltransferase n=1 Tax=Pseudohaliea sp. TaxID=2740289 RepID=UPI0032EF4CF9
MILQLPSVGHCASMPLMNRHPNCGLHNWLIYRKLEARLDRHLRRVEGTIYDLGCGESPYRARMLERGVRYVGIDWERSLHSPEADLLADLNRPLALPDASADAILCISVLEHLRRPELCLAEAARLLKPGGVLLLQVPWQWSLHELPHDWFRYSPVALEGMLSASGFREIDVATLGGFFTMMTLKLNYFSRRFVKGPALLRFLSLLLLLPFWSLGQLLAPLLDQLDRSQAMETSGYFVVAVR